MTRSHGLLFVFLLLAGGAAAPPPQPVPIPDEPTLLDDFESPARWQPAPADGVSMRLSPTPGHTAGGMRFDFDFQGHAGYAIARLPLALDLPENYEISFWVKAAAPGTPANTLEFKLVDPSGENVWWLRQPDFRFPQEWQPVRIKKRKISFAWGPTGGGEIRRLGSLEIVVTAGSGAPGTGGHGAILLDDLTIRALPPADLPPPPIRFQASSSAAGSAPESLGDGDLKTAWRSDPAVGEAQSIDLDLGIRREFGAVSLTWCRDAAPRDYALLTSEDGQSWRRAYEVRHRPASKAPLDLLYLPESEARYLRLQMTRSAQGKGYGLAEVGIEPLALSATPNEFFTALARNRQRGTFPRAYSREQSYWTLVGAFGGPERSLLGEDGAIEPGESPCSIEPFLVVDGRLLTWADAKIGQSLEEGDLPIPSVTWELKGLTLAVTPVVGEVGGRHVLFVRYRVRGVGTAPRTVRLVLALRPFQVNPPPQFLNRPGGVGKIERIAIDGARVALGSGPGAEREVLSLTSPSAGGASGFPQGEIGEWLRAGDLPRASRAEDANGFASGALAYDLRLGAGKSAEVEVAVPLHGATIVPSIAALRREGFAVQHERARRFWRRELGRVTVTVPPEAEPLVRVARSNLAYILIDRDGPALQPGARAYQRAWIRDGALISSALLRFGIEPPVRDFLRWYAGFQYEDGKIPCCVDRRGADPVPENDSHGEFLFLVAEHYRFGGDRALLESLWPRVQKTVDYIDTLRNQRRTERYRTEEGGIYFGLLPDSISHEGYSSKPAHSYWDDFFALKGLKDAAELAQVLGKTEDAARFAAIRDEFRADFYASMRAAIARHGLDFIPGSADLGDFDATSTTIALNPVDELPNLPRPQLDRTFERYWEEIERRIDGRSAWTAYTPYELRSVGAFVRLGWRDRAQRLLAFFLGDLRPRAWNQWPEVVWRDPRVPGFLGDLPHAWVGSDYLRSFLDLFAYERSEDRSLVLGAGIPARWLESPQGVGIRGLRTHYGTLSYSLRKERGKVVLRLWGDSQVPPGGFVLSWPYGDAPKSVLIDGLRITDPASREIAIRRLPAKVTLVR